jgi:hypothetical protein
LAHTFSFYASMRSRGASPFLVMVRLSHILVMSVHYYHELYRKLLLERLLDRPLDDFRKYCIWRIFVPYFINVKGLSRSDAFNIIKSWLDRCTFVSRQKIDEELLSTVSETSCRRERKSSISFRSILGRIVLQDF